MKLILKYLGKPSEEDLSFMTDEPAIQYIKDMSKTLKAEKVKSESELDSIKNRMLQMNPYFRCSAAELLKDKIFDQLRINKNERSAQEKILLDIDRDESFNYETGKSEKYTFKDYKEIVQNEVSEVHSQWLENVNKWTY